MQVEAVEVGVFSPARLTQLWSLIVLISFLEKSENCLDFDI